MIGHFAFLQHNLFQSKNFLKHFARILEWKTPSLLWVNHAIIVPALAYLQYQFAKSPIMLMYPIAPPTLAWPSFDVVNKNTHESTLNCKQKIFLFLSII